MFFVNVWQKLDEKYVVAQTVNHHWYDARTGEVLTYDDHFAKESENRCHNQTKIKKQAVFANASNPSQPHVSSISPSNVSFDVGECYGWNNLGNDELQANVVPFHLHVVMTTDPLRYRLKGKEKVQDGDQTLCGNDVSTMVAPKAPNAKVEDDDSFWGSINFEAIISAGCSMAPFANVEHDVGIVVVWPSWSSVVGGALAPFANTFNIGYTVLNFNVFNIKQLKEVMRMFKRKEG